MVSTTPLETASHIQDADNPSPRLQGLALLHRILIAKLNDPFNGYRAFSRKALETLDQDFDPSYGVETEINYQLRKVKTAEIPATVKYHEASSKANSLLQGLNPLWSILRTALTKIPALTLTLGATSLIISITLFIHVLTIFNATRYIRLTHATLVILLEIAGILLISIATSIMNMVHYRRYIPVTKTTNNAMGHVN
jgi:hypothetical protein